MVWKEDQVLKWRLVVYTTHMRTSFSALETFETCPLKYKFQEIERIKTPKRVEQVFGTVVHSALRYMFVRDPLYPTLDEILDHYGRTWKEAAEKIAWIKPGLRQKEEEIYFSEGVKLITNFYKKNKPWTANAVELEARFSAEVIDPDTGAAHTLSGVMDRLDKDPEKEEYEIIDYKTGKRMPAEETLADNLQLGLYATALRARWPHIKPEQIKTTLYFLKHNDSVSAVHTNETLERAKRRVLATIGAVEKAITGNVFEPTPGPLCNYCGFRPLCPMWSHEYKKEEAPTPSEKEVADAISEMFAIKKEESILKKRAAEARAAILTYMEKTGVLRVFGSSGFITKQTQERFSFDMEKVRPILERIGKWSAVLSPDEKKLLKVLPVLSDKEREEILLAREEKKFTVLKTSMKKGIDEEEEETLSSSVK